MMKTAYTSNKAVCCTLLLSVLLVLLPTILYSQVLVTNSNNATVLAKKLTGPGVVISNATMQCEQNQAGHFVTLSSNLGQDSGIVLTSGIAGTSGPLWGVNSNEANLASFNQGNVGDASLTALAGIATYDRCILEFDFVGNGDSIFFQYVFGSEEYPFYNCTNYNDVFGFFISGPGYPTPINIALVPGTTIPVAINSINNGIIYPGGALSNCNAMGPGAPFTNLYINNTAGTSITYSGFTQVLTSKAAIQPCSTYHLKLAIADGFDNILDSGVFLKAGSLTSNTVVLEVDTDSIGTQNPYVYEGCDTAIIKLKRKIFQSTVNIDTFNIVISGSAIQGSDYNTLQTQYIFSNNINDTQKTALLIPINDLIIEGTEFVKIVLRDRCNNAIDSVQIDIKDPPTFTIFNNDTTICQGQFVSITGVHDPGMSFVWTPSAGVNNTSLFSPSITPNVTTSYVVTGNYGTCLPQKDTINITVLPLPTLSISNTNIACNGLSTGTITSSSTSNTLPIVFNVNPPGINQSGSPSTFPNLLAGTYTVTVTDGFGCTNSGTRVITQPTALSWNAVSNTNIPCNAGNIATINANANGGTGAISYLLNPGAISNSNGNFSNLSAGQYTVTATDVNGCSIQTTLLITQTSALIWSNVTSTSPICNGQNTGFINASATGGVGTITYTLNPGNNINTTGSYSNLSANNYTITAMDVNGCTTSSVVAITQPNPIVISQAIINNVFCHGASNGTIQIVANGGTGTLTYTAMPGGSNNTVGYWGNVFANTFTITVSDINNCNATTIVTLTQPPMINITVNSSVVPTCVPGNNGSISVSATGGVGALQYKLNNGPNQPNGNFSSLASGIYTVVVTDGNFCTKTTVVNITSPNVPILSSTTAPLTCQSPTTTINVSASNGVAPYNYVLQPGNISNTTGQFTNVGQGTYTVSVTGQNGCSASIVVVLTLPDNINFSTFNVMNIPCVGITTGSVSASVSLATPPVSFTITPGNISNTNGSFTGLTAGVYTMTASDVNGCTTSSAFTISNANNELISNFSKTDVNCNGLSTGSVSMNFSGLAPLNAVLSPGNINLVNGNYTGLAAGTYTVTVTDAAFCTTSTIFTITQPNPIVFSTINTISPSCIPGGDGSLIVNTVGGVGAHSYALNNNPWQASNTFPNLSIATYTIQTVDANNCSASTIVNLSNPQAPTFVSLSSNQIACSGANSGTVTAITTGGTAPISYNINPLGITNATGVFSNLPVNVYTVSVADANGCIITSTITINQPSQIVWLTTSSQNVSCASAADGNIIATISGGVTPYTYNLMPGNVSNTSGSFTNLNPAIYTVTASDANACTESTTFIITQPPALSWFNVSHTNYCNNTPGSISVTSNGGIPMYTYTLLPSNTTNTNGNFVNLNQGVYTVVCSDANSCSISTIISILQSPLITIGSVSNTIPTCTPGNDATISVSASGGQSPLQYAINGGLLQSTGNFNSIGVSVYTIVFNDAIGCTVSTSVNVTNPTSPSISSISSGYIACFAGTTSLSVSASGGVGALTYAIVPNAQSNTTGIFNTIPANNYTVSVTDANNCAATTNYTIIQPPQLVWDSIDNRDVACFGGSNGLVVSSASGGTGAITYFLNPPGISNTSGAFFGLGIGSYTLTATDSNGCSISSTFLVNQSPPITWNTITATSPLCFGGNNGSISASANGGNGNFVYNLQPGNINTSSGTFSNLSAGTYTLKATDAKSCTLTTIVNVSPTPPVQLSNIQTSLATCVPGCDGSVVLTASGGNGVYSYALNGGTPQGASSFTALCSGTYTVSVADANGCMGSGTFNITTANGPSALAINVNPILCNGQSNGSLVSVISGGNAPYTYQLLPSNSSNSSGIFNNLAVGAYTIVATDANGCTINNTALMTQPFPVVFAGISLTPVSCFGGSNGSISTTATGGNSNYVYSVNPGNLTNSSGSFTGLTAGTYTISVVDGNACSSSSLVTIAAPTALTAGVPSINNVSCFNGANGSVSILFSGGTGAFSYQLMPGNITNTSGNFTNLNAGTFVITATDANNCTLTSSIIITQPTALTVSSILNTFPTCTPGNDANSIINVAGGTAPYSYSINGGTLQASNIFNNLGIGNYTISVLDANLCSVTTVTSIQASPLPVITSITATDATCVPGCDGSLTITASGGTAAYSYSSNGVNFQAANTLTGLCANTYTIIVMDALNCTVSTITPVATVPGPVLLGTTITNTSCNGVSNGAATINIFGGTSPYTYLLEPINLTNTNGTFTSLAAGSYTISASDINGCSTSSAILISQPQSLLFNSVASVASLCFGAANGSLTATTTGGSGAVTYTLLPATGSFVPPATYNGLLGNTNYTVTASDANGCTTSTVVLVPEPSQVLFSSGFSQPVSCNGAANGSITVSAFGGVGTVNYTLQPGASTNSSGIFTNLAGNNYTITAADVNGCTSTTIVNVFEPTAISITNATATDIICFGQVNGTLAIAAIGGTAPLDYTIMPSNQTNQSGLFNSLNAATYTITITDANNCTLTTTLTISEPAPVVIGNLVGTDALCFGQSNGTITVSGVGGVGNYFYSITPQNNSNITGQFSGLSTNTFTVTVSDANGCSVSSGISINQPQVLQLTLSNTQNVTCFGAQDGIIVTSATGGTTPYVYTLMPGNTTTANGFFTTVSAGNYIVYVTDQNACQDSVVNIIISQPPPLLFTSVTHEDITCYLDSSGSITAIASGGTGTILYTISPQAGTQASPGYFVNIQGGTYLITATDASGCSTTSIVTINQNLQIVASDLNLVQPLCYGDSNGSIIISAIGGVPPMSYSLDGQPFVTSGIFANQKAGTHTITIMDSKGCKMDTSFVLTQPDKIRADVSIAGIFCVDQSDAKVSVTAFGGRLNYTYYLKPGLYINKSGKFNDISPGSYTLSITDDALCRLDTIITVSLPQNPLGIRFNKKDIGCFGYGNEGSAEAIPVGGTPPYSYLWYATPMSAEPKIEGLRHGKYVVEIIDAMGCKKKDSVYIEPGPCCDEVFIPNAFTPNDDGTNDTWRVVTAAGIELLQLDIYNRWGNRVWSATNITDSWDGTYKNEKQDMGTFFYLFRYKCLADGEQYIKKGDVILMR